jgi:hypothetical protein
LLSLEPLPYTKVDGQVRREYFVDSLNTQAVVQNGWVRIDYLNPGLPNGHILVGKDLLPDHEKRKGKLDVNHDFQMVGSKVRLSSTVRDIVREFKDLRRDEILEYTVDAHLSLPRSVYSTVYFRRNALSTNYSREEREEEIRVTFNLDAIDGLYYTGDYDLQSTTFSADHTRDLLLAHHFYNNLNVAPGRWFRALSLVNFAFGAGSSFDEYAEGLPSDYSPPRLVWRPPQGLSISSANRLTSYYGSVQLTPFPNLSIWAKHTLNKSGSTRYTAPDLRPTTKEMVKIEYEPANLGALVVSWDGRRNQSYPIETFHNVYFEWSRPWSSSLRTKLITNYLLDEHDYGPVTAETSEFRTSFETLLRFGRRSFVILSLGGIRHKDASVGVDYALVPSGSLYLNLLGFLHLQFDHESTFSQGDTPTHTLSTKITGQF